MKLGDIQALIQIINGIVVTLGILGTGLFSFISRFFVGTLQISQTLISVTRVENTRVAIVRIQIKNLGRSRIKKGRCFYVAEVVEVQPFSEPIGIIPQKPLDYSKGREIFKSLTEIDPNGETYEDVAFTLLTEVALFMVSVKFILKRRDEAWQTTALFNADESAKIPSKTDPLAEQSSKAR